MENRFIRAEDVAQELNVSKPYAYKLIRQLNEESAFERAGCDYFSENEKEQPHD